MSFNKCSLLGIQLYMVIVLDGMGRDTKNLSNIFNIYCLNVLSMIKLSLETGLFAN